ncbi:uncharacterized protein [Antedon mediterranea]|uniref:uncharacterized protein n=1 Tax=Antedon mediterranea TaxID=105859 RepID=UPI003AF644B3
MPTTVSWSKGHDCLVQEGWKQTLSEIDQEWISKALFKESKKGTAELDSTKLKQMWFDPPQPDPLCKNIPKPRSYFGHRLLLWMLHKIWLIKLVCTRPGCKSRPLTSAGLYRHVRLVLDLDCHYILATEYLECPNCHAKQIGWSNNILEQLDLAHRLQFPAVLSYRLACDNRVLQLLKHRGFGNSPSQLHQQVLEQHIRRWNERVALYLQDCKTFRDARDTDSVLITAPKFDQVSEMIPVPSVKWFLTQFSDDESDDADFDEDVYTFDVDVGYDDITQPDYEPPSLRRLGGRHHRAPPEVRQPSPIPQQPPSSHGSDAKEDAALIDTELEDSAGPDNISGYAKVEALADCLFQFKGDSGVISKTQAEQITQLWNNLKPYDKIIKRHQDYLSKGRFKRSKTTVIPGVESTRRCFLGQNTGPAQWPDCNRYMECLITKLCEAYKSTVISVGGNRSQRWPLIVKGYKNIRRKVLTNGHLSSFAPLQLMEINRTTLIQWYNRTSKKQERQVLESGISATKPKLVTSRALPEPLIKPAVLYTLTIAPSFTFVLPESTVGQATVRNKTSIPVPPGKMAIPPLPSTSSAPAASSSSSLPVERPIPRSVAYYRKQAANRIAEGKQVKRYKPRTSVSVCSQCKQPRLMESHAQYFGTWYCAAKSNQTMEDWKTAMAAQRRLRKQQKK